ncbi:amidohydrolase family protein [Qipengyuania sp. CAU 1752]
MADRMGLKRLLAALIAFSSNASAIEQPSNSPYDGPVIDVHLHADSATQNGPHGQSICPLEGPLADIRFDASEEWRQALIKRGFNPPCETPLVGASTDKALRDETIAEMRRHKVRGLISGPPEFVRDWTAAAPDLFWPATKFYLPSEAAPTPEQVSSAKQRGETFALAEIVNQYAGLAPGDARMDPFWKMAEREQLPVGIHIGLGPPGSVALFPEFRAMSPLEIDPVLRRFPRLRIFAMHAGYPYLEDMKAMLYLYPQLMVETGVLQFQIPRAEYYAYLEGLVRAGFADRIMFGSDQMNWPGAIGEGVRAINSAPFLSFEQKKAILHDNAARFLRVEDGTPR